MKHVNMTITIPEELKKKMKNAKDINWSEVARKAFEEEIKRIERKNAAEEMDRLREESKIMWDGIKEIRKWRDLL
ncbi:MAG: hypothetical protein ACUVTD_02670 [Nitrososphaerales archaeon]